MSEPISMMINDVKYVREDSIQRTAEKLDGMEYVIARTYSAGVHAGYLKSQSEDGKNVVLVNTRRIYTWKGAATITQMAMEGVKYPKECQFSMVANEIRLTEVIEINPCTEAARISIAEVPEWKI